MLKSCFCLKILTDLKFGYSQLDVPEIENKTKQNPKQRTAICIVKIFLVREVAISAFHLRGHWLNVSGGVVFHAENAVYAGRSITLKIICVFFRVCVCFHTEESWILDGSFIVISEMMLHGVAK